MLLELGPAASRARASDVHVHLLLTCGDRAHRSIIQWLQRWVCNVSGSPLRCAATLARQLFPACPHLLGFFSPRNPPFCGASFSFQPHSRSRCISSRGAGGVRVSQRGRSHIELAPHTLCHARGCLPPFASCATAPLTLRSPATGIILEDAESGGRDRDQRVSPFPPTRSRRWAAKLSDVHALRSPAGARLRLGCADRAVGCSCGRRVGLAAGGALRALSGETLRGSVRGSGAGHCLRALPVQRAHATFFCCR